MSFFRRLSALVVGLSLIQAPIAFAAAGSPPNAPSELGMESGLIPCVVGSGRPFVHTRTPELRALLTDEDGSWMDAGFRVLRGTAENHTWDGNEQRVTSVPSGSVASVTVSPGVVEDGQVYTWHLWAGDDSGRTWSRFCEFEVDSVAPGKPSVSSVEYPEATPTLGVGRPGTFTFRANGNADVQHYLYSFSGDGANPSTRVDASGLGGEASVTWAPTKEGTTFLTVRSVDRAGNRSPIYWYEIRVLFS
ncbi:hypothetical protein [Allokutzneria oryzae]|uniref:Uncharacterized protein n=1 Tax=Allokutzneria oryzae TaxID=1378989 RepID=A0ABV5ZSB3_9PSEU